jgi:hypothetical protein
MKWFNRTECLRSLPSQTTFASDLHHNSGQLSAMEVEMKISHSIPFLLASLIFATTTFVVAQESSTTNKQTTVKGCLSGPNSEGAYMLKTTKGRAFEVGGNDQLKSHVGHEVKLTGNWVNSGSEIGENESAEKNEKSERGEHQGVTERHFKVAGIQHVSDTCSQTSATTGTNQ